MNHLKIYSAIINKASLRKDNDQYVEHHHIVPRCMGGSNEKVNIVALTFREHFLCHWLLCKIHPKNFKLKASLVRMIGAPHGKLIPSHYYDIAKRNIKDLHYPWLKNKTPWNKGKKGSQVAWNKGVKMKSSSKESAAKKSKALLERNEKERDAGIPHYNKGRAAWNKGKRGVQVAWNKGIPKPRSPCPYCNKSVDLHNMKRWHADKCKEKKLECS